MRWLFKAEGLGVDVQARDWPMLVGMGSGSKHGLAAAGIDTYEEALPARDSISKQKHRSLWRKPQARRFDVLVVLFGAY